jgi:hypothetical protein
MFRPFAPSTAGYGDRIRQARTAAGLTVARVCQLTATPRALWRAYESAKSLADGPALSEPVVIVAAAIFGVTLDWLAYGSDGLAKVARVVKRRVAHSILIAFCLSIAAVANAQTTVTISGFTDAHSSGWVEKMSAFNGQWSANQIKPIQLNPSSPGTPIGARVGLTLRQGQVVVTLERAAWNPPLPGFPATIGYVAVGVVGLPTGTTTGTININAYPGDTRRIVVQ